MKKLFALVPGLVVLLAIVSVGAYYSLGAKLRVKRVEISISPDSEEIMLFEEIKATLAPKLEKLIGESMIQFSFQTLVDEIRKDKRIKDIYLRREFPASLLVQVRPHEPVVGWVDKQGFVRPVSQDNQILPRLKSGHFKDYALLRGKEFFENTDIRQAALDLLSSLPLEGYFRRAVISEIRYSKASGFDLILSEPSVMVKIGTEDYQGRAARLEKVLSYIQNRGIKGRVIDSRFDKKVVVRLRNEP